MHLSQIFFCSDEDMLFSPPPSDTPALVYPTPDSPPFSPVTPIPTQQSPDMMSLCSDSSLQPTVADQSLTLDNRQGHVGSGEVLVHQGSSVVVSGQGMED